MPPYYSKNVKENMKARRKKKMSFVVSNESTSLQKKEGNSRAVPDPDSNWKKICVKIKPNVVKIPSDLFGKEARKFRKDKRREARARGDVDPVFESSSLEGPHTLSDSKPPNGKRKREHIKINELLEKEREETKRNAEKEKLQATITPEERSRYLAVDCEMVGIGTNGKVSCLARVSLTDFDGKVVLDSFVTVPDRVTDFRTWVSGVRPSDIKRDAISPAECRQIVGKLFIGKIIVGHSIKNDLKALMLTHPRRDIRDTARYKPYMKSRGGGGKLQPRKLKDLAKEKLGIEIQVEGESHSSIDDARAAMELFKLEYFAWEKSLKKKNYR